jgi:FKBP-type peptidyl-prolyl cis-trans isomerase 2
VLLVGPAAFAEFDTPVSQMGYGREEEPVEPKKVLLIEDGNEVTLEFILSLADGSTVETNIAGGEPFVYTQGRHQILPALEAELKGLKRGERKRFSIPVEDAYGPIKPALVREVDIERIPEPARVIGFELIYTDLEGNKRMDRVIEIKGDRIVLDGNHSLAGESLHYKIRVLAID